MLILVRHGRTVLNAEGRLQGRLDIPLDDVGKLEAVAVAARVGPVDELISSPLARARQTADAWGLPYEVDDRWVELSYGEFEGVPHADFPSAVWSRWWRDGDWVPEGGESLNGLVTRVREACEEMIERARDHRVAVVSHVSPIKAAVAWSIGADIDIAWRSHLSHASICRIDMREIGPVLCTFNETVEPMAG
ncbi:MAG: histidine phosphatase family protein [Acidimicrobiia bacterium]|nr:histidine phosphatase family protein [Acidimicrobiia bacterium]